MNKDKQIIIRDRQDKHQYTVHNRVLDEWFPLIGHRGMSLYNLYARMANKTEEKSWPTFDLIAGHMQMSRGSVSSANKILEWCGLIHIDRGGRKRANEYFLLNIQPVTPELLAELRQKAEAEQAKREKPSKVLAAFIKRIDNYKSIDYYWKSNKKKSVTVVRPGQMSLFDQEPDGSPEEPIPQLNGSTPSPNGSPSELIPQSNGTQPVLNGSPSELIPPKVVPNGSPSEPIQSTRETPTVRSDDLYGSLNERLGRLENQIGSLCEHLGFLAEHDGSQGEPQQSKQTIHNNNPNKQSTPTTVEALPDNLTVAEIDGGVVSNILDWFGFRGILPEQEQGLLLTHLLAWACMAKVEKPGNDPVSIVRSQWRQKGSNPPVKWLGVASIWLRLSPVERQELLADIKEASYHGGGGYLHAGGVALSGITKETFLLLWRETKDDFLPSVLMPPPLPVTNGHPATAADPLPDIKADASHPDRLSSLWEMIVESMSAQGKLKGWLEASKLIELEKETYQLVVPDQEAQRALEGVQHKSLLIALAFTLEMPTEALTLHISTGETTHE